MQCKSTISDLYANKDSCDNDDKCAPDDDQKYTDKIKRKEDVKVPSDIDSNDDKLEDINDMGKDDDLLLNGNMANGGN